MTFASAERAYLEPIDPHECDDDDCDGDLCEQNANNARDDAAIDRADSIRKGEYS